MKISMCLITASILITLLHSCTTDTYTIGAVYDEAGNNTSTTNGVTTSYLSCPINNNYTPAQAERVRLTLEPCDAETDLAYELDATAQLYFQLGPDLDEIVAKESLLAQDVDAIEAFGQVHVYDRDKLVEKRIIQVSARGIPTPTHEGIIACYPLDGNGTDLTAYANHATIELAVPERGIEQNENGAMKLDGEEAVIYAPHQAHLDLTDAFTLSAWVNIDEQKTQSIVRKGATINGPESVPFSLALSDTGDIVFAMHNKADVRFEARKSDYPLCEWIHLAATYDNGKMKLYEDGRLVQSAEGPPEANTNDKPLLIGTRLRLQSDTMDGSLDEVRIYGRALTGTEIEELSIQYLN